MQYSHQQSPNNQTCLILGKNIHRIKCMTAADKDSSQVQLIPERKSLFQKRDHYYVHTRFLILLTAKNKYSVFVYSALQQRSQQPEQFLRKYSWRGRFIIIPTLQMERRLAQSLRDIQCQSHIPWLCTKPVPLGNAPS